MNANLPTKRMTGMVLTSLAASMLMIQHATAVPLVAGTAITNTAYLNFQDIPGVNKSLPSNTVNVSVATLYGLTLSPASSLTVHAGSMVTWLNTLQNTSNTDTTVQLSVVAPQGTSNIRIYVDSNHNGQLDAAEIAQGSITQLNMTRGQAPIPLLIVADTDANLTTDTQVALPVTATIAQHPQTVAQATDTALLVVDHFDIDSTTGNHSKLRANVTPGSPIYLKAAAEACNFNPAAIDQVFITVKSRTTGDSVTLKAHESGANSGLFLYDLPTQDTATKDLSDQILQVVRDDRADVSLTNCSLPNDSNQPGRIIQNVTTQVDIDPYGIVFDAKTNLPVAGATVTLVDEQGNPVTTAYSIDPITGDKVFISAKIITNADGKFVYPFVPAGNYKFLVDTSTITSGKYTFVSNRGIYSQFSAERIVNPSWSYAGVFTLQNNQPALNVDIPIDPVLNSSVLFVRKEARDTDVELGDFDDYNITVTNRGTVDAQNVSITDHLPTGFSYVPGTMRVNGTTVADPVGGKGPYLTLGLGNLTVNAETKIQYRVYIGPNALSGDGINRVRAKDASGVVSNEAAAKVTVRPGVLLSDGFIVGKVYTDCNRNGIQDPEELGVPGVRLYLEDGTFVITDRDGKYNLYGISAKTHVLKLDRTSLPAGVELVLQSNRNMGDPGSRFVDMKRNELHRADFAVSDSNSQCGESLRKLITTRQQTIEQQANALESMVKSDLPIDPQTLISDVRAQPAEGCINNTALAIPCTSSVIADASEIRESRMAALTDPVRTLDLEKELAQADSNQLAILNLKDQQVLPYAQVNVQVKAVEGTSVELSVNGQPVEANRVGKRATLASHHIQGLDFIGIDLNPGINTLKVVQRDALGNIRDQREISLIAPGQLKSMTLGAPAQALEADGKTVTPLLLKILDSAGVPITTRTPVTLDTSAGQILLKDLDPASPGIQIFVEGGQAQIPVLAPLQSGDGLLKATSGIVSAEEKLNFVPALRPMIAAGIIEGNLSLRHFDPSQLVKSSHDDGFEQELQELSSSGDGKSQTSGRAAFFLKGKVKGSYLLTLAYDSDKDKNQRLFRDIRPDEFYPVYGDSSAKGFDAQSTSKLYVRLDHGRSYALYGDFNTRVDQGKGLQLGQYNRSLTGLQGRYETDSSTTTAFAARTNSRQRVNEQRGMGISGPYTLNTGAIGELLSNSEKLEIIVRDRDNPGLIISQQALTRFTDYEIDTFSNSIYLKNPLPTLDANFNPVYLRVTVESDEGGPEYTVAGVASNHVLNNRVRVGGSYVQSDDPLTQEKLGSVNAVVNLSKQLELVSELARSSNTVDPANQIASPNASAAVTGQQRGTAGRIELNYHTDATEARLYHQQADTGFYNMGASISSGRKESGLKSQTRIQGVGLARFEAIRTEDIANNGTRQGLMASLERSINQYLTAELGARYYEETVQASSAASVASTPYNGTSLRIKLNALIPQITGLSTFAEYEQDVQDSDRKAVTVGGSYQLNSGRIYLRHELMSSLVGSYGINDTQRRNATVLGIESNYMKDGTVFSEYRIRDGISARESEAALGLRNSWYLHDGIRLNTSFEKVQTLKGATTSGDSTAVSVGVEYLPDPLWKGVAKIEKRWSDASDSLLTTLGAAYKYSDDITLLARNNYNRVDNSNGGYHTLDRFQIGAAYRDYDSNRFDSLSKLEYRIDKDHTVVVSPTDREAIILSTHLNYHPVRRLTLAGNYAAKYVRQTASGIESNATGQVLGGRILYDIDERWDAGLNSGVLWSNQTSGVRYLLGAEIGRLMAANLWLSAGYNFQGYRDDELTDSDTTLKGAYIRLRFKFDEDLFRRKNPAVNSSLEPGL